MKQLSKRTFILACLQLQGGGQASRQQQASSPQAPVDRIRLLCSRLLLLLTENEKVAPAAWQGAHSPHTQTHRLASTHACTDRTHNDTCAYLHKHMQTHTHTHQPASRDANIFNQIFICRIYHVINFSVLQQWLHSKNRERLLKH